MRLASLFALSVLAASPASAQSADDLYREGVAARHAGETQHAIELLQRVVALEPRNSDALVQLGYAMLAADRLGEAEAAFRRALAIAPDYSDARIGLARVAQRRGDSAGALRELQPVDPSIPEARSLRAALSTGTEVHRLQMDLDLSYSDLDGPQPDWKEGALQLRYQTEGGSGVTGRTEIARRFRRTDVYGEIALDRKLSDSASLYVSLGGTPNADFRPKWQLGVGGAFRLVPDGNVTLLTVDTRQARYAAGDIQTLTPGIEQYLADGKVWLTARWINTFDQRGRHSSGWLARGDVQASDRLRLFGGASDAPDTSEGIVIDTFSLFSGASLVLGERYTARASVAHEDRNRGADRLQISLGMGVRF